MPLYVFHVYTSKNLPLAKKCWVDLTCFSKNLDKKIINQGTVLNSLSSLTRAVAKEARWGPPETSYGWDNQEKNMFHHSFFLCRGNHREGILICSDSISWTKWCLLLERNQRKIGEKLKRLTSLHTGFWFNLLRSEVGFTV